MSLTNTTRDAVRASQNVAASVTNSVTDAPRNIKQLFEQVRVMGPNFILGELGQMGRVFTDASNLIQERRKDVNDITPTFAGAVWRVMLSDYRKRDALRPVAALEFHKDS